MDRFFAYTRLLATGAPVGGATITVYAAGTLGLATIFDNNNSVPSPKPNPFLADTNGYFFFYALAGRYDVRIEGGGPTPIPTPYTWGDVTLGDSHVRSHELASSSGLGPDHTVSGLVPGDVLTAISATAAAFRPVPVGGGGASDHGFLAGLGDDDHAQYALLSGRDTGQTLRGGVVASGALTLDSTVNAVKGAILLNPSGGNVGVGLSSPSEKLQVAGIIHTTIGGIRFPDGTLQITAGGGSGGGGGEWAIVGSDIHNTNTGNVGIGTTAPVRRLHVLGSNTDTQLLRLEAATGRPNVLEFITGGTALLNISADPESAGLFIPSSTGSIRINQLTGNVSIGAPSAPNSPAPPMPLYVTAPAGQNSTLGLEAAAGNGATISFRSGTTEFGTVGGGSTLIGMDCRLGSGAAITGNISLKPSTGDCGIGTFDPQRKLHVIGGGPLGTESRAIRVETPATAPGVSIELYDSATGALAFFGASKSSGANLVTITEGSGTKGILIHRGTGFVGIVPDFAGFSTNPARPLEVESLASIPVQIRCRGRSGGGSGIEFFSGVQKKAALFGGISHTVWENVNGGNQSIAMDHTIGFVGIGTFGAIEKLDVAGNVHATGHTTSSDERFKDVLGGVPDCLERLCELTAVRYRWNRFYREELQRGVGVDPDDVQIGLVAQHVLPHFPELVRPWYLGSQPKSDDPKGSHYYSILYEKFVPVLIEAIKELAERVEELERKAA